MVRTVPSILLAPELLVTLPSLPEIIGSIGLIAPVTAEAAFFELRLLLIALCPVNVDATRLAVVVAAVLAAGW